MPVPAGRDNAAMSTPRASADALTLDLPRLVMRRAAAVAVAVLLAAALLGLGLVQGEIDDEVDAALSLAGVAAALHQLPEASDRVALQSLGLLQTGQPLRHLRLSIHGEDGRLLLAPPDEPAPPPWLAAPLALHRALWPEHGERSVAWVLTRPDGRRWTLTLAASMESERREALANLGFTLGLLLACTLALLAVMRWNMRRAFRPLGRLVAAIAGIEGQDSSAMRHLPAMPIAELERLAAALRHLAQSLDQAESRRRQLGQQVLTLQEDERSRLAAELHDELGQRLTALRVDAAWLQRQLADLEQAPRLTPVVSGMAEQVALLQQDTRALLARLQPFGPARTEGGDDAAVEPVQRLAALLQALVEGWQQAARQPGAQIADCRLELQWCEQEGQPAQAWPATPGPELPRQLALTLYRISQEALTNVARHAQAGQACLSLCLTGAWQAGAAGWIAWQVVDDGLGLDLGAGDAAAAQARGNGLAGLRERIWACGGDLQLSPALPGEPRPGLRLQARLPLRPGAAS